MSYFRQTQRHRRFQAKAVATTFTSRVDRSHLSSTHEAVRTRAPSLEVGVHSVSQCTRGSEDQGSNLEVGVHSVSQCTRGNEDQGSNLEVGVHSVSQCTRGSEDQGSNLEVGVHSVS